MTELQSHSVAPNLHMSNKLHANLSLSRYLLVSTISSNNSLFILLIVRQSFNQSAIFIVLPPLGSLRVSQ